MVLSNKKLKQKLRAEIAEHLTSSVHTPDPNESSKADWDPNSQRHSLKQLLNSVIQKPILSKREKKRVRTHDSLEDSEIVSSENNGGNSKKVEEEESKEGDKKEKKRKRNGDDVGDDSKSLDLVGCDGNGENGEKKKKKKKKAEGEEEGVGEKEAKKLKKKKIKKKQMQKKKRRASRHEEKSKADDSVVVNEESNNGCDSQVNEDCATRIYVGGIPYNASENDIRTYFEGCGTITEIDYMTFPDSGKFRGIAIINFRTEGAAKRALALDGSEMDGLFLKIQPYKMTKAKKSPDFAPKIVEGYNRIYVGNLSWDITEDDFRKLFSDCKISSIRFGTNKETGEFRGYAHVDFSDSLSLSMALKLDQEVLCGRPVKISCAVPPKKGVNMKSKSADSSDMVTGNVTDNAGLVVSNINDIAVSGTTNGTDDADLAAGGGKLRRRTCYECGEKGHLSSACPNKTVDQTRNMETRNITDNATPLVSNNTDIAGWVPSNVTDNAGVGAVSGKIKRRTCYECGEKGHLSSVCPNKTADQTSNTVTGSVTDNASSLVSNNTNIAAWVSNSVTDNAGVGAVSGKIKRRTCYECGEKGHLSSACPNKTADQTSNTVIRNVSDNPGLVVTNNTDVDGPVTSTVTDDAGLAALSGKIRRRTCYECGEKGHLSSACPKKTADQINSNTYGTN